MWTRRLVGGYLKLGLQSKKESCTRGKKRASKSVLEELSRHIGTQCGEWPRNKKRSLLRNRLVAGEMAQTLEIRGEAALGGKKRDRQTKEREAGGNPDTKKSQF